MALSPKTKRATDKQIAYANAISEFITGDKMFDKETVKAYMSAIKQEQRKKGSNQ